MSITKRILKHKFIFLILFSYFVIHVINLTLLPIFNDESIYLDWGWSSMHIPSLLFISLSDAKQPLMIWFFGIAENMTSDPLLAGRLVSVAIGSLTLVGIYSLTRKLCNVQIALFASLTYMVVPLFVFYNRQALFEAGVACMGIWLCYALIRLVEKPKVINGVIAGAILGIGLFTKSSFLLFFIAFSVILLSISFRKKEFALMKQYLVSLVIMGVINFILFTNPLFWKTFSSNSRYALTLPELIHFPIVTWLGSLFGFLSVGFTFITPFIFIESLIGSIILFRKKDIYSIIFLSFFFLALLLEIIVSRSQAQRYLMPFLPFLAIASSIVLSDLWNEKIMQKTLVAISLLIPFILTTILVFNPPAYILGLSTVSPYSEVGYIKGQTSGYGINKVMAYIKSHSLQNNPSLIFFGANTGNPENAIDLYSEEVPTFYPLHIEGTYFKNLQIYTCVTSDFPVFLVTRGDQLMGMDKFFAKLISFTNPYDSTYSVGIYTIPKSCKGTDTSTLSLSKTYFPVLQMEQQFKTGNNQ